MITAALDNCGSRSLRTSKIVLIGYYPPSPPGVTNGTGSCGPGPGGAGGPGGKAGAKVEGGGGGPAGSRLSRRAPGGAFGGSGTGVPGMLGAGAPGRPASGIPGAGGRPFGLGGDESTSGSAGYGPLGPNGPWPCSTPAHGIGLPGRGDISGGGAYEHGDPGTTAGPG